MLNPWTLLGNAAIPTLIVSALVTGWLMSRLTKNGRDLQNDEAPKGVMSFEFCWSVQKAQRIVKSWGAEKTRLARSNIRLDFLFIPAYVVTLGLLYGLLSHFLDGRGYVVWSTFFLVLAWVQIVAGSLDVVENVCMLEILNDGDVRSAWLPRSACICAATKFVLTGLGAGAPAWVFFTEGF